MQQQSRTFILDYKQEAMRLLETSGKSGIAHAKELGISNSILYRWRKELRADGADAFWEKGIKPTEKKKYGTYSEKKTSCGRNGTSSRGRRPFFCRSRDKVYLYRPVPRGVSRERVVSCAAYLPER